jgi:hypothetical protein
MRGRTASGSRRRTQDVGSALGGEKACCTARRALATSAGENKPHIARIAVLEPRQPSAPLHGIPPAPTGPQNPSLKSPPGIQRWCGGAATTRPTREMMVWTLGKLPYDRLTTDRLTHAGAGYPILEEPLLARRGFLGMGGPQSGGAGAFCRIGNCPRSCPVLPEWRFLWVYVKALSSRAALGPLVRLPRNEGPRGISPVPADRRRPLCGPAYFPFSREPHPSVFGRGS